MIVDDERILRLLVRTTLENEEDEIIECVSGDEALTQIAARRPDLILLDWMMPGLSGIDVARRLHDDPQTSQIPVIMLTARDQAADRSEGEHVGVFAYLVKPFSPLELIQKVEEALLVEEDR